MNYIFLWQLQNLEDLIELIRPFAITFWSFIAIFVSCELSERMSMRFDEIKETINQSNWYSFPIEVQRMLPPVLMYTQEPIFLHGFGRFGTLTLTRETFKKVISTHWNFPKMIFNSMEITTLCVSGVRCGPRDRC